MKRLMVYSHDTYGLGNLRRMLAICEHLSQVLPELTILLLSGSPLVQQFRLSPRLDYLKLPCLTRVAPDGYAVKSLGMSLPEAIHLRSELMLAAAANFKPDLFLVDKKPFGIKNELEATLNHLKQQRPRARQVLILRDILDAPEQTIDVWQRHAYHAVIEAFYDLILVLGAPEVFDLRHEYQFPAASADRVRFCGYLRRGPGNRSRAEISRELQLANGERSVLVTAGGGQDGYGLLATYLASLPLLPDDQRVHSLLISGPEMRAGQRRRLAEAAARHPRVVVREFTDDFMSYLNAADVVISMGGYNTVCEVLSARKRALVVPRVSPVQEQWLRAERMARLQLVKTLHPARLTPEALSRELLDLLNADDAPAAAPPFRLDAQTKIAEWASVLLAEPVSVDWAAPGGCPEATRTGSS